MWPVSDHFVFVSHKPPIYRLLYFLFFWFLFFSFLVFHSSCLLFSSQSLFAPASCYWTCFVSLVPISVCVCVCSLQFVNVSGNVLPESAILSSGLLWGFFFFFYFLSPSFLVSHPLVLVLIFNNWFVNWGKWQIRIKIKIGIIGSCRLSGC